VPRAVVTGGAGFVGSHLCERLLREGWAVLCVDSMITGVASNIAALTELSDFSYEQRDVSTGLEVEGPVDWVLHFASPASPVDYQELPLETLMVGSYGTHNALKLARAKGAGFYLASTSEVYGDPQVHPQPESYWGNVNPIGPRSVYDEAKRYAEALTMAHRRTLAADVRVVRIFNTYGPRMRRRDGRAVPTFIDQSLRGAPLTVHGDGSQTRSLCYIDDLIEGLWRMLGAHIPGPVNLGNPAESTILELAKLIVELAGSPSEIVFVDRPVDDPDVRRPDISLAMRELGWEPRVKPSEGLHMTIEWARQHWKD
jgi:dTDP-glucose 4,6-dehydratase